MPRPRPRTHILLDLARAVRWGSSRQARESFRALADLEAEKGRYRHAFVTEIRQLMADWEREEGPTVPVPGPAAVPHRPPRPRHTDPCIYGVHERCDGAVGSADGPCACSCHRPAGPPA